MKKLLPIIVCFISILLPFCLPIIINAQTQPQSSSNAIDLVPCDGPNCGLADLVILVKNIINAVIIFSIPLTTIVLTYVGFLVLTARGNVNKIQQAKHIAWNVIIGFLFILTAWVIIHSIAVLFLKSQYRLFF